MARSRKSTVVEQTESTERKRIFTQGATVYEVWGTEKSTGAQEKLAEARTSPAALATFQLAKSMGAKTHTDFFVKKVSILSVANGQLTAE